MDATTEKFPLGAGDSTVVAQMSLCIGGLVQTWTGDGDVRLWSVHDDGWLRDHQATGIISRTERDERRFREVGMLHVESGTLIAMSRFPVSGDGENFDVEARLIPLGPPVDPGDGIVEKLEALIGQAIVASAKRQEFLIIESGGWDAPPEPYCLFVTTQEDDGPVGIIETAPVPDTSEFWAAQAMPDGHAAQANALLDRESVSVIPMLIVDAIRAWDVPPWDLTFTFGQY